jgi:hypothetical protein
MKLPFCLGICAVGLLAVGCLSQKPAAAAKPPPIVTPDATLTGRIVSVNSVLRFAVLNFPVGRMAQTGQVLHVYRNGLKVGEVKVSGPQRDDNIVADISTGEAQKGDEVKDR